MPCYSRTWQNYKTWVRRYDIVLGSLVCLHRLYCSCSEHPGRRLLVALVHGTSLGESALCHQQSRVLVEDAVPLVSVLPERRGGYSSWRRGHADGLLRLKRVRMMTAGCNFGRAELRCTNIYSRTFNN